MLWVKGVDVAAQSAVPSQEMADSAVNVATTVVGKYVV